MMMKILNWVSGIIILLWLAPSACLERIEPGKIGVRRSLSGGVSEEDFRVGYHLSLPFWHSWYQLDGTLHYLEFNRQSPAGPLELRTDNTSIFIDVTIPYRIRQGEGWEIVKKGFSNSYKDKMKSQTRGVLRKELAKLSSIEIQVPEKRQALAEAALPLLNEALSQYHIEATHVIIRSFQFRDQYERKLQNKQVYVVQGRLDQALEVESKARQETETLKKTIDKDLAVKAEEWNRQIEELKSEYELQIAAIQAKTKKYVRSKRAEADAMFSELQAEGNLAEAKAEALGEKLKAQALASKAGRTFSAIEAAKRFELGDIQLNSSDPRFLYQFGSMAAWRRFFIGE